MSAACRPGEFREDRPSLSRGFCLPARRSLLYELFTDPFQDRRALICASRGTAVAQIATIEGLMTETDTVRPGAAALALLPLPLLSRP
jgi:hypothetical protein